MSWENRLRFILTASAFLWLLIIAGCTAAFGATEMCDATGACYPRELDLRKRVVIQVLDQLPAGLHDLNGRPLSQRHLYGATTNFERACFIMIRRDKMQYLYHELMHCTGCVHD